MYRKGSQIGGGLSILGENLAISHLLVAMGVAIVRLTYQSLRQWISIFDLCIFAKIVLVTC